jgi:hypothetical protein
MPIDLTQLSDEQLEAYRDLVKQRTLSEADGTRNAINHELAVQTRPAAPKAPVPAALTGPPDKTTQSLTGLNIGHPQYLQATGKTPKDVLNAAMHIEAAGMPGPGWLRALNGATVSSPADLGTVGVVSSLIPGLDKIKAGSRGLNALLGAAKGAGLAEVGLRTHAGLEGKPQPGGLSTRTPMELGAQGLSALAGGLAGRAQVPKPVDRRALAEQAFEQFISNQKDLKLQRAQAAEKLAGQDTEATSLQQALADARTALKAHENTLAGRARNTQIGNAEELQSNINRLTDYLERLKSKEHAAEAFLSRRPDRVARIKEIEGEIANQTQRREKAPQNKGWQGAIDKKIESLQKEIAELSDPELNAKAIADEILRAQAQRRQFVTDMRRAKSGWATPSISDADDAQRLGELRDRANELTRKVSDHSLAMKQQKQRLKEFDTQLAELDKNAPKQPDAPGMMSKTMKTLARKVAHSGLGAEFGSALSMGPAAGIAMGLLFDKVATSESTRKLLELLNSSQATRAIPALVNRSQERKQ